MKKLRGFIGFMVVWVGACYLQSTVFQIESSAYIMAYGWLSASAATLFNQFLRCETFFLTHKRDRNETHTRQG